jgi:hypothetical protein
MAGGWLARTEAVADAVLASCDALDGVTDGVSATTKLRAVFDPWHTCAARLADWATGPLEAQLKTVQAMYHPSVELLPGGVHRIPGGRGGENARGTGPVGGWISWQTGTAAPTLPPGPDSSRGWLYGSGAVQYFFAREAVFDPRRFNPDAHAERLRQISALMDSTDPDLSAFAGRGGKLIVSEHMADYAQSPYAGIEYYRAVVARMGQSAVDSFMRLYVTPRPSTWYGGLSCGHAHRPDRLGREGQGSRRAGAGQAAARAAVCGGDVPPDVPLSGVPALSRQWRSDDGAELRVRATVAMTDRRSLLFLRAEVEERDRPVVVLDDSSMRERDP